MGKFDVYVPPEISNNPLYGQFIKVTPRGAAWKVTAIKASMGDIFRDMHGCTEESELSGVIYSRENAVTLEACAYGVPRWYRIFKNQVRELREAWLYGNEFVAEFPDAV